MKIDRNPQLLKYKNLLTKEFLEKEYIKNKKSITQLQQEFKIYWSTIKYYLLLNKIPIRTHKEQAEISSPGGKEQYNDLLTKEFLTKEYIDNKKGILDLKKELKLDFGTIRRYLKKYNILTRKGYLQREISHPPKEFLINKDVKAFIDGLILGDASIPKRKKNISPRSMTQACKYKEYLEYISKRLSDMGITCSPILSRWIKDDRCKNKGYNQHFLQTRRYKTFEVFRKSWYKNGKKIIPNDIEISKDLLLQGYLCDGNFYREIRLCTDAFDKDKIEVLKRIIEDELKIKMRIVNSNGKYELAIKKSDTNKFLNYIGPCPVKCYEYKWKDNESEELKERKRLKARIRYHDNKNDKK